MLQRLPPCCRGILNIRTLILTALCFAVLTFLQMFLVFESGYKEGQRDDPTISNTVFVKYKMSEQAEYKMFVEQYLAWSKSSKNSNKNDGKNNKRRLSFDLHHDNKFKQQQQQQHRKLLDPCFDSDFFESSSSSSNNNNNLVPPPCQVKPEFLETQRRLLYFNIVAHERESEQIEDSDVLRISEMFSITNFLRLYRNATRVMITRGRKNPVTCLLLLLHTRACSHSEESVFDCISRLGLDNVEQILPARCLRSGFWQAIGKHYVSKRRENDLKLSHKKNNNNNNKKSEEDDFEQQEFLPNSLYEKRNILDLWKTLPRGTYPDATTWIVGQEHKYVPPSERTKFAVFEQEPKTCKDGTIVHPFGFGTPEANVVDSVPTYKTFDFMLMTPSMHGFENLRAWHTSIAEEQFLREQYSSSYFAFTHNRGGWDCARTLEILAAGSVPYFIDLPAAPKYRVVHIPRKLLIEAMDLYGVKHIDRVERAPSRNQLSKFPPGRNEYFQALTELHLYIIKPGNIRENFRGGGGGGGGGKKNKNDNNHNKDGVVPPRSSSSSSSSSSTTSSSSAFSPSGKPIFDHVAYTSIAKRLLNFTRNHLTSGAFVSTMLRFMKNEGARRVLLISRFDFDYMHLTIHTGFHELGIPVTVVGQDYSHYFYQSRQERYPNGTMNYAELKRGRDIAKTAAGLYGGGFFYSARGFNDLQDEYVVSRDDPSLISRIKNREFDLVVFTYTQPETLCDSCGPEKMPYFHVVRDSMKHHEVAVVDHDDWQGHAKAKLYRDWWRVGFVFAREMPTASCMEDEIPGDELIN